MPFFLGIDGGGTKTRCIIGDENSVLATGSGSGYYVLGTDGGIFTFGDANFLGAHGGLSGAGAAAAIAKLPDT